ncbi:MAG: hypothetical protein GX096_13480 [Clostridiales bacterium]|nr:hypothetical protein [Clostridiales bacterium]
MQPEINAELPAKHGRTKRKVRVRYSNRMKCLLCYLISFSVPVLWQLIALRFLYPYKLTATAPDVTQNLLAAFPFLEGLLSGTLESSAVLAGASPETIRLALEYRDAVWQRWVLVFFALAWLITLVLQLFWRVTSGRGIFASKVAKRAIHTYRLTQLIIWGVNAVFAFALLIVGVRFIAGRTYWDYLVYFLAYLLNGLAAMLCFRLAAPPMISGKHAFFKRL